MVENLTEVLRPTKLEEFIGQKKIISKDSALYRLIKSKKVPHCCFWGKSGSGKTTLAKIIANETKNPFFYMDGTSFKVEELRKTLKLHKNSLTKPFIFIDEIHRLSKTQQEVLLIPMEKKECVIIGATTENPAYSLTNAMNSRMMNFEFESLSEDDLKELLKRVKKRFDFEIEEDAKEYLISSSGGDARAMLNLLEYSLSVCDKIDKGLLKSLRNEPLKEGVSSKENHYDFISALIKSIRGSDIDASLYYLAKLLEGGERSDFIARRLVILSSEDIGNANPNALNVATNTLTAVKEIGHPEDRIILSQCVVYLASSPKSNSSYKAINEAIKFVKNNPNIKTPPYLTSHGKDEYLYPHDFGGYVKQKYILKEVKFYNSKGIGFEKNLNEWIKKIKGDE
ncbi:MAG: replication-associated recombination protein A [Epsilonproteobacteria bacterium]|nr:replication-associated recombination protein A [Campylobacterota bacterium]